MQGIPWSHFGIERDQYLLQRRTKYRRYRSTSYDDVDVRLEAQRCSETADVFGFTASYLQQKPAIQHFQLLNLIWATDSSHVYFLSKEEGKTDSLEKEEVKRKGRGGLA